MNRSAITLPLALMASTISCNPLLCLTILNILTILSTLKVAANMYAAKGLCRLHNKPVCNNFAVVRILEGTTDMISKMLKNDLKNPILGVGHVKNLRSNSARKMNVMASQMILRVGCARV